MPAARQGVATRVGRYKRFAHRSNRWRAALSVRIGTSRSMPGVGAASPKRPVPSGQRFPVDRNLQCIFHHRGRNQSACAKLNSRQLTSGFILPLGVTDSEIARRRFGESGHRPGSHKSFGPQRPHRPASSAVKGGTCGSAAHDGRPSVAESSLLKALSSWDFGRGDDHVTPSCSNDRRCCARRLRTCGAPAAPERRRLLAPRKAMPSWVARKSPTRMSAISAVMWASGRGIRSLGFHRES